MARCCGCNSCGCKVQAGVGVSVTGTGSPTDPFVISANSHLKVIDNETFNLSLSGSGAVGDEYALEVNFAATSSIDDLGDVDTASASSGQVLGWNGTAWVPTAAVTAPVGAVSHDVSLTGDGSGASPLEVRESPVRLLATATDGLGLSDAGMNATIRKFSDTTARAAAAPVPDMNTISILGSNPGQLDYYTGTEWQPITGSVAAYSGSTQLLALSGAWNDNLQVEMWFRQVTTTTDTQGSWIVLDSVDLAGRAGVLSVSIQPTSLPQGASLPWSVTVKPLASTVQATAWFVGGTGGPIASQQLTYSLIAYLY